MILTKIDIDKMLVFKDDDQEFCIFEIPLTKDQRTKAQHNTMYRCLDLISKHLGYPLEEVKQATLKGLFGVRTIKLLKREFEVGIICSIRELDKDKSILYIETLIAFGKKLGCGEMITSRELQNLFNK